MTDEMIVDLYWQRDEQAITMTRDKYEKYLYAVAYRILQHEQDSEESVNDTYIGAWNTMPPKKPHILRTYLGKLTRNISLKRVRKNETLKRGGGEYPLVFNELSQVMSDDTSVEDLAEQKSLAEYLDGFLAELEQRDRVMFLMRYWYLCSVKEIASKCGYTQSKVKMSLKRTRDKLRLALEKEDWL